MDIKAKYNHLFYKTCCLIEAIEDFEKVIEEDRELVYHPRFIAIKSLINILSNTYLPK